MKIENNGPQPLSPKKVDGIQPSDKKKAGVTNRASILGKDHAEVTDVARLLTKARASLESTQDVDSERLDYLRQQIESGNYVVPMEELAKRLLARFRPTRDVEGE